MTSEGVSRGSEEVMMGGQKDPGHGTTYTHSLTHSLTRGTRAVSHLTTSLSSLLSLLKQHDGGPEEGEAAGGAQGRRQGAGAAQEAAQESARGATAQEEGAAAGGEHQEVALHPRAPHQRAHQRHTEGLRHAVQAALEGAAEEERDSSL